MRRIVALRCRASREAKTALHGRAHHHNAKPENMSVGKPTSCLGTAMRKFRFSTRNFAIGFVSRGAGDLAGPLMHDHELGLRGIKKLNTRAQLTHDGCSGSPTIDARHRAEEPWCTWGPPLVLAHPVVKWIRGTDWVSTPSPWVSWSSTIWRTFLAKLIRRHPRHETDGEVSRMKSATSASPSPARYTQLPHARIYWLCVEIS